jgi:hypothetical protein
MEGKKRDRPPFFNQVFRQLIDDYKNNNKTGLIFNALKAFKQLEAAEVDPSLLAYSLILNKDPDDYQHYTPQHKIGKSLQKEPGSLILYYKTGKQEDGYKGHSTNYQDLDIDVYKIELWKLIKDVLRLLDCDIKELESRIFPKIVEDDGCGVALSGISHTNKANKGNNTNNYKKLNNIQRNESLDKYNHWLKFSLFLMLPSISNK